MWQSRSVVTELTTIAALPVPTDYRRPAVELFNHHLAGPISEASVARFIDELRAGNISRPDGQPFRAATVARYIADLKDAISKGSDSIRFRSELDRLFRGSAPKVEKRIHKDETLTPAEIRRLERGGDARTKAAARFLALSGMRISEALNVHLSDCKIGRREVLIRVIGKGRKERTVPVTRESFDAVRKAFDSKDYLFQNHHHTSRDGRFTRQRWHQIISGLGQKVLDRQIHPHTFRHATATNLLAAGWTLKAVASHLGHARVSTTAEIYDENTLPFRAIQRLEKAINGNR